MTTYGEIGAGVAETVDRDGAFPRLNDDQRARLRKLGHLRAVESGAGGVVEGLVTAPSEVVDDTDVQVALRGLGVLAAARRVIVVVAAARSGEEDQRDQQGKDFEPAVVAQVPLLVRLHRACATRVWVFA